MGIITWIIFGALAGWLASIITGRNRQMGCIANIVVGIVGEESGLCYHGARYYVPWLGRWFCWWSLVCSGANLAAAQPVVWCNSLKEFLP